MQFSYSVTKLTKPKYFYLVWFDCGKILVITANSVAWFIRFGIKSAECSLLKQTKLVTEGYLNLLINLTKGCPYYSNSLT